jgi:hypothetical protein
MGKLSVNTAVFDMSGATEEGLKKFDRIRVNTALLLVSGKTKQLLAQGSIHVNMAKMLEVEEGCEVCTVNGGMTLGPDSALPSKPTFLIVNGDLTVNPGSEKVVQGYTSIHVNGGLTSPCSISNVNISTNGNITLYPDEAVLMDNLVVNESFARTAQPGTLFYVKDTLRVLDADPAALLDKKVAIIASYVLVREEYEETLSRVTKDTKNWESIPRGYAYLQTAELDESIVYQHGKKLYVSGNLYINRESLRILESLETLVITGQAFVPETLVDIFKEKCKEMGSLTVYEGELWRIPEGMETLSRELLDDMPDGVSILLENAQLAISPDISNDDLINKVYAIHGMDSILVVEKHQKIPLRKKVKGDIMINVREEQGNMEEAQNDGEDTKINTAYYKL